MVKTSFYELSQCILSYHDWLKVDGLWDLLPNYQKTLTDNEHWQIIINTWSMSEHNSQIHNRDKWIDILTLRNPIKYFKKNLGYSTKVYRAGNKNGFSWTLNRDKAIEFQKRYTTNNPIYYSKESKDVQIISKQVQYDDVKFYNNLRDEEEIVIIP
tara:strand:+ start:583 stop:1050 length:468 start_codon:yes stop_codon:yes gene_type:complete